MAAEQKLENPILEKIPVTLNSTEKLDTPENKTENIPSKTESKAKLKSAAEVINIVKPSQVSVSDNQQQKRAKEIDSILSEGLNEVFLKMKPEEQKTFQKKGEETVLKINELLNQTKLKVNKIVSLIKKWLLLITGINRFFLEQEVKLKADKIIRLRDK